MEELPNGYIVTNRSTILKGFLSVILQRLRWPENQPNETSLSDLQVLDFYDGTVSHVEYHGMVSGGAVRPAVYDSHDVSTTCLRVAAHRKPTFVYASITCMAEWSSLLNHSVHDVSVLVDFHSTRQVW